MGKNNWAKKFFLKISTSCDFLSNCQPLIDFYGEEFPLKRNPFFIAISLDDRPATPCKGTNTVLIDGHEVEQHSESNSIQRGIF